MTTKDHVDKKTFVHLSDIHFVKNFSDESKYDLDSALRHALEQDAERMMEHVGHVDGILVSGDIAFAGKVEEYEIARNWLSKLSSLLRCDPSYVWCVPGNHDVDQSVQKAMPTLFDTYKALRGSKELDEDLKLRLASRESGPLLFQPLKAYHEQFGAKYDCPTTPKQPWWEDELFLNDGSRLRIRGVNSALISSSLDDENTGKLILGSVQTQYEPEQNVVYLTLCHHPPDWLLDGGDAHEAMVASSNIQLFGHKHTHRHETINQTLRLHSGAVHPVRKEKPWEPRYYFIAIKVEGSGKSRHLVVDLYPRVWSKTSRSFVRDAGDFEGQFLTERLKLPKWNPPASESAKSGADPKAEGSTVSMTLDKKKLVNRFMMLPYHSQLTIMRTFGLFDENERKTIPDTELFISCFQRAREKGVLDKVWDAIESETRKTEG